MEMRPTQSNRSNSLRSGWSKSMSVIAAMAYGRAEKREMTLD